MQYFDCTLVKKWQNSLPQLWGTRNDGIRSLKMYKSYLEH